MHAEVIKTMLVNSEEALNLFKVSTVVFAGNERLDGEGTPALDADYKEGRPIDLERSHVRTSTWW